MSNSLLLTAPVNVGRAALLQLMMFLHDCFVIVLADTDMLLSVSSSITRVGLFTLGAQINAGHAL